MNVSRQRIVWLSLLAMLGLFTLALFTVDGLHWRAKVLWLVARGRIPAGVQHGIRPTQRLLLIFRAPP